MSSLLETFFIMFASNADQVKHGAESARRSAGDLEDSLNAADRIGVALGEHLMETFKEIGAGLLAGFGFEKLKDAISEVADLDAQLGLTSKRLNISVEDLSAWERATKLSGGATGEFSQSLDFLNRGMATIATTGTSRLKPFFDELKIKVTDAPHHVRPLLDILLDLSDAAHKMGAQQFTGVAEKLGLGPGLTLLVQSGRLSIEDLIRRQKELGGATQESADRAIEYRTANLELEDTFEGLYRKLGASVIPALSDFLKWVTRGVEYLEQHEDFIRGFFIGAIPAVLGLAAAFAPLTAEMLLTVGAFALGAAAVLAVGAAFALAYDDMQNFLAGNKSIIGEFKTAYPEAFEKVITVLKALGTVLSWVADVAGAELGFFASIVEKDIGAVLEIFHELQMAWDGLRGSGKLWAAEFPLYAKIIELFGDHVISTITGVIDAFLRLADIIRWFTSHSIGEGIADGIRGFGQNVYDTLIGGNATLAGASASPYNSAITTGGARSVSIGTINVTPPPGANATDFAGAISRELQSHLRDTANHFDDGVDR